MPPSLCSLPLFDKQRNRITIWTGPGAARKPALPFSCILCSMKGAQETHKSARQGFLGGESYWKWKEGHFAKEQGVEVGSY